jgi:hypothetical protein
MELLFLVHYCGAGYRQMAHWTSRQKQILVVFPAVWPPIPLQVAAASEGQLARSAHKMLRMPLLIQGCDEGVCDCIFTEIESILPAGANETLLLAVAFAAVEAICSFFKALCILQILLACPAL